MNYLQYKDAANASPGGFSLTAKVKPSIATGQFPYTTVRWIYSTHSRWIYCSNAPKNDKFLAIFDLSPFGYCFWITFLTDSQSSSDFWTAADDVTVTWPTHITWLHLVRIRRFDKERRRNFLHASLKLRNCKMGRCICSNMPTRCICERFACWLR